MDRDNEKVDEIVNMLDKLTTSDVSRIKIMIDDEVDEDFEPKREHHHGRCDIGSPWARGCSFDVLE